jgi:pilus assembly protein CpaE
VTPSEAAAELAPPARGVRRSFIAFAADAETEAALRQGLSETVGADAEFRRAGVTQAIAFLRSQPSPRALVVDLSGHPQPFAALEDLATVVEPDARVLVVGDRQDLGFYRHVTRGIGATDYLHKPLTSALVAETFAPAIRDGAAAEHQPRGGRFVALVGARGGVGASTLAAALARHLAADAKRHCLALDGDLRRGTLALLLGAPEGEASGAGLRAALESPARLDELFLDRAAQPVSDRLNVLAAQEGLLEPARYTPGAAERLLGVARRRYNFVVGDVPVSPEPFARDLLALAHQRLVVMEPTLASVRDALRVLNLPVGPGAAQRPLLVLNRAGRPGGLPTTQVAEAMGRPFDVVVPDLPKAVEQAATLGVAATPRAFRQAVFRLATACGALPAEASRAGQGGLLGLFRRR